MGLTITLAVLHAKWFDNGNRNRGNVKKRFIEQFQHLFLRNEHVFAMGNAIQAMTYLDE
jgi:hypothetical protein